MPVIFYKKILFFVETKNFKLKFNMASIGVNGKSEPGTIATCIAS